MPRLAPPPLRLSDDEQHALQALVNRHQTPQQLAKRARIILLAAKGYNYREIARELNTTRDTARHWCRRWQASSTTQQPAHERLQDAPRSGKPTTFTLEQLLHLFAIACESPQAYRRPISHWSARELADELIKQGLVDTISVRHVARLLEEADLKPHQSRYWLTPKKKMMPLTIK